MFTRIRALALGLLLTCAAVWLWAHEGHRALPTRGARLDPNNPNLLIVTAESREALGVQVEEVAEHALSERLVAPATVVAPWQRFAFATARLGGRVTAVRVRAGEAVQAGQVLGEVESLELERLQLQLREARNDVRLTRDTLADLKTAEAAVSAQVLAEAAAKHQEAENTLELARRKLLGLGLKLADLEAGVASLPIASPVAGTVGRVHVQVGQVIEPTHHLFEISDTSQVWVKIGVLEMDLGRVTPGLPVEVRLTAYPADVFRGTLRGMGLGLDPVTHQGIVWADFTNTTGARPLLPGMFGRGEILLPAPEKRVTVPAGALIRDGAEYYVLVETGPGQYLRQFVAPGRRTRDRVEIRAGQVLPGDRVVTVGALELAAFFGQDVLRLSPEAVRHLSLKTEPVQRRAVAAVVRLSGEVELPPDRRALASARLAGTVHAIHVERDQAVKAGDVIAEVASLELQDLQLELLRSHLKLELLRQTLERLRPLAEQGGPALTRRQWREAEAAAAAAQLRKDSLRKRLLAIGLVAEQVDAVLATRTIVEAVPVRAPRAGVVVSLRTALGQAVKAEDSLIEIHDPTGALVRGYVSERQLGGVFVHQRARVRLTAEPGWVGEGEVVQSSQEFLTADRTLSVWVRLKEPPPRPIRHGQFAQLTLLGEESPPVLAVPRDAVLREGSAEFVFVRRANGVFDRRPVVTGRADDLWSEIVQGVELGEDVATRGVQELQTGYSALR